MEMTKKWDGKTLTLALVGRLDTLTAPQLEEELKTNMETIDNLILDFEKLSYISSAGLRVLLAAQKRMNQKGGMTLCHVNDMIMDVFDMTGFADILTIQ